MDRTSIRRGFAQDRISNLPCDVIDQILTYLPLRDAVRTSILSKEWRHKWITIPHLVFDRNFKQSLGKFDVESVIHQILILHKGPLVKFSLKVTNIKCRPSVDHWLHILSSHGIEDLALRFSYSHMRRAMPYHIFSFDRLRHLYLTNGEIRPPHAFKGFGRLVRLDLVNVHMEVGEFKRFVSKCPMLEYLNMRNFNCNTILHLEIDAPKLKTFHIWSQFSSICFENTSLEEVSIRYDDFTLFEEGPLVEDYEMFESVTESNFIKVFRQLSSIRRLESNNRFLQFLAIGGMPQKLPNTLNHLNHLQLSDVDFENIEEVTSAVYLIRSSPNLQSLEISSETLNDLLAEPAVRFLKAQQQCKTPLSRLKNVKMNCVSGLEPEMEFVKLLLLAATILRKLEIKSVYYAIGEGSQMLKELTSFCPASPKAEILFIDI